MKKMLILIALTVVLTLGIALVITGCGGSDSGGSSDGTTLTLWTHNNEESWNASYQSIVDAYRMTSSSQRCRQHSCQKKAELTSTKCGEAGASISRLQAF